MRIRKTLMRRLIRLFLGRTNQKKFSYVVAITILSHFWIFATAFVLILALLN